MLAIINPAVTSLEDLETLTSQTQPNHHLFIDNPNDLMEQSFYLETVCFKLHYSANAKCLVH